MNRLHRFVRTIAILTAAVMTALTISGAPIAHAAEVIPMDPASLPRGADNRLPHAVGDEIVDGAARIPMPPSSTFLAKTADGYLVKVLIEVSRYSAYEIRLITATSSTTLVADNSIYNIKFSGDQKLMAYDSIGADDTMMWVVSLPSGTVVKRRLFPGQRELLGVEGESLYLTNLDQQVGERWDYVTDEVSEYDSPVLADPAHGLFAGGGADGCTALWKYDRLVWRSCDEEIIAFNQTGRTFATRGVTSTTKNVIRMRGLRGALQVTFTVNANVRSAQFETPGRLMLNVVDGSGQQHYLRGWRSGANLAS